MSFTRSESERLARLKGCTTGLYCRYGRPTGGITGPTGPAGYSFFTLGGNQGALAPSTGSILVVNMSGPTGTVGYSNILQASQTGYTDNTPTQYPYLKVDSDIIPAKNNMYSIGSQQMQFKSAYFGANTVYIDGVPIGSTGGTTIVLPPSVQLGNTLLSVSGDTLILPETVRIGSMSGPVLGATGPTGPGGAGGAGDGMTWITKHLLETPPPIEFELPIIVRSSEIFIGWKYPEQEKLSFMDIWVPAIFGFKAKVNCKELGVSSRTNNTIISISSTSTDVNRYIDLNGQRYVNIGTTPIITGLILTNVEEELGYKPNQPWPGDSGSRNIYRYYTPAFENLDRSDPTNKIEVQLEYTNLSKRPTTGGSISVNLFITPGPPGIPRGLTGAAKGSQQIDISFGHPERTDMLDENSKATIEKYIISYSTGGSDIRYGGPISHGPITVEPNISVYNMDQIMSYQYSGLYPESEYTFNVRAYNSAQLDGSSAIVKLSTGILGAPVILGGLGIDTTQFYGPTIRRVKDNVIITNLVNASTTGVVRSTEYIVAIHLQESRASTDTGLAVASVGLESGPTVSISYDGFGHSAPANETNGGLSIVVVDCKDNYTAPAQQGFYLRAKQRALLEISGNIIPSPDPYQFVFTQTNYDGMNPTPIYTISTNDNIPGILKSNYQFYYDFPQSTPTFIDVSFSLAAHSIFYISGIKTLIEPTTFTINASITNMGQYFYKTPLLQIRNDNNIITKDIINLSDTNHTGTDKLPDILNIITTTSASFGEMFLKEIDISMSAANISTMYLYNNPIRIPAIIDIPSYLLLTNLSKTPQNVPIFNPTSENASYIMPGFRLAAGISKPGLYTTEFTDVDISYNHDIRIDNTEELQIFNGKYRAKGTTVDGYINYSNYSQNTYDYSSIDTSGYRFASFKWKLSSLQSLLYMGLSFHIHKLENVQVDPTQLTAQINGKPLLLYYRLVEGDMRTPTDANSLTSVWANGNTRLNEFNAGTYFSPADNSDTRGGLAGVNIQITSDKTIIPVKLPKSFNREVTLYCRIGLPMNENCAFEYISAEIKT